MAQRQTAMLQQAKEDGVFECYVFLYNTFRLLSDSTLPVSDIDPREDAPQLVIVYYYY